MLKMKNEVLVRLGVQEDIHRSLQSIYRAGVKLLGNYPKRVFGSPSVLEKAEKHASYTSTVTFVAQVNNTIVSFYDVGREKNNEIGEKYVVEILYE